jgi:hypothetical protein
MPSITITMPDEYTQAFKEALVKYAALQQKQELEGKPNKEIENKYVSRFDLLDFD